MKRSALSHKKYAEQGKIWHAQFEEKQAHRNVVKSSAQADKKFKENPDVKRMVTSRQDPQQAKLPVCEKEIKEKLRARHGDPYL